MAALPKGHIGVAAGKSGCQTPAPAASNPQEPTCSFLSPKIPTPESYPYSLLGLQSNVMI